MKEILITSSVLILALLLLRRVFAKKVSRGLIYGAWALVALRLLIPVQIGQLDISVLTAAQEVTQTMEQVATRPVSGPSKQEVYQDILVDYVQKDQTVFVPTVQEQIREEISQGTTDPAEIADKIQQKYPQQEVFVPQVEQQVQQQVAQTQTGPTLGQVAKAVWLGGVALMALWLMAVNLHHIRLLRRQARKLDVQSPIPVYVSDGAASPCLVGLLRPAVYLTPRCAEKPDSLAHVLKHELTHYRHGDHIWALVRCICLCVYWFDPLVWAAAYMSRRDCELACDEGAMRGLGEAERTAYGRTLLEVVSHAAGPGKLLQTATSMNETMKQLKERVDFIVRKPKISITAAICMVVICAMVAGCVAAGPTSAQSDPTTTTPTTTTPPNTTVPGTTAPQLDVQDVKTLVSNMYCSSILVEDLSVAGQVERELNLTITEYTDGSISWEMTLPLTDDCWYDFAHSGNFFTVEHEELGLPYYCAKAHIYQPVLDAYLPYDFAVDLDMGYMIFKLSSNVFDSYVVASSDPGVDPLQIAEHFSEFFQIYDHTDEMNFYFDMHGAWISENGGILGEMPFYVAGKLPDVYEDGDTVEMELNFIWPESSGYRNEGAMTYTATVNIFAEHHGYPNFHGTGTLYDSDTNEPVSFVYNIFPEDLTVIIYVNGQYLINYSRGTTQIEARLNYFKEFIFTDSKPDESVNEELEKFNALFADGCSWYGRALSCEYATPQQFDLYTFFLNGFPGESRDLTDAELAELKALYKHNPDYADDIQNYDIRRLPVDRMNEVLRDYIGITLEDVEVADFDDLDYLESTNCYYIIGGGASGISDFNAIAAEHLEDGTIRLTYTQFSGGADEMYVAILMPNGDGYRILSNMSVEGLIKQEIAAAWNASHEDKLDWEKMNNIAKFCAQYHGAYNGKHILVTVEDCPITAVNTDLYVGPYVLSYNCPFTVYIYENGTFVTLQDAYAQGLFTAEEETAIFTYLQARFPIE